MAVRGGAAYHWKDQKAEREQMRQREHPTSYQRRLAVGLGGSASASERAARGVRNGADKDAESNDDREENGEEHLLRVRPEPHA